MARSTTKDSYNVDPQHGIQTIGLQGSISQARPQ